MHVKYKTGLKAYFRVKLVGITNDIGGYCLCVQVSIMKIHKIIDQAGGEDAWILAKDEANIQPS